MMTTTVKLYGWNFCFNKEITESYYKDYDDLCDCAMCRNFYNNAALINNDVRCFLEQFGIDVAKPIEQESIIADKSNNTVENAVYYVVNGSA